MGGLVFKPVTTTTDHNYHNQFRMMNSISNFYTDDEYNFNTSITDVKKDYNLKTAEEVSKQSQDKFYTSRDASIKNNGSPDGIVLYMPVCCKCQIKNNTANNTAAVSRDNAYEFVSTLYSSVTTSEVGCFSYDSYVTTKSGVKRCGDLVIGDKILACYKNKKAVYEEILFFGHREDRVFSFIELTMKNKKSVYATNSHYIYRYNKHNKEIIQIKYIRPGDYIKYNNKLTRVTESKITEQRGIISPFTKSCEIVVDNVHFSCITDTITEKTIQPIINLFLAINYSPKQETVDIIRNCANAIVLHL